MGKSSKIVSQKNLIFTIWYSVCIEKYLKAKVKSYNGKINTNFHNNKMPKEGSQWICWSVILINSVFRIGKNCHLQAEECKYAVKEKRRPEYITDYIEISSHNSGR